MKKKILCSICARKSSKGLKGKNIFNIYSTPLIAITIHQALKANIFDQVVVSTDCSKIRKISIENGASSWFLRNKNLSKDTSPKIPVIIDLLEKSEKKFKNKFDIVVDLDPTSPLRKINDIKQALNKFIKTNCDNLITGSKPYKNPYFNMIEIKNKSLSIVKKSKKKYYTRQSSPKVYDMNASIYIWKRKALYSSNLITKKTAFFEMPRERSIDIDSKIDLLHVLSIIKEFKRNDLKIKI